MFTHFHPAFWLRPIRNVVAMGLLFVLVSSPLAFAGGSSANWDPSILKDKVSEFTLDNGLRFIVMERHDVPVFSFMTHVNAGSVNEPVGQTGVAHMFEHMAFKGTQEIGTNNYKAEKKIIDRIDALFMKLYEERNKGDRANPEIIAKLEKDIEAAREEAGKYVVSNEFSQIIDQAGGVGLNAGTGSDGTYYFYSMPSNKLELWAYLESARFKKPVFREFYKERDVVQEERNMRVDSQPIGQFIEEMLGIAYRAHPYKSMGIGHRADLDNLKLRAANWYFETYYTPQNLVISVVGDVYPDEVKKMAEKYFSSIPRRPNPPAVHTVEPIQKGERRFSLQGDTQPIFGVGFHRPSGTHSDDPALTVLARVLGQGRTSRLFKRLVKTDKSALFAGAFNGFPGTKYPSLLLVFSLPNAGHSPEEMEKTTWEEIGNIRDKLITEAELARVKTEVRAEFIRGIGNNQGLAGQLAAFETLEGSWEEMFNSVAKIEAVTREEVQAVAKKYLTRSNGTVGYMITEDAEDNDDMASK